MLDHYRQEYVEFNSKFNREFYLYNSGQKDRFDILPIYERYSDLFSLDAIASLRAELDATSDQFNSQRVRLQHLLNFAVSQYLQGSVKDFDERISSIESKAAVELGGRQMTFNEAAVAISTESDRNIRVRLYANRIKVIEQTNALRVDRLALLHDTAQRLDRPG